MSFVAATTQRLSLDRENNRHLVLDNGYAHSPESRRRSASTSQYCERSSIDSNLLSPILSRVDSDSLSPSNNFEISNGSASGNLSQYQPSDFSDLEEDPFFGVSFTDPEFGTPNFLDGQASWDFSLQSASLIVSQQQQQQHVEKAAVPVYPLTPEQTASIHSVTPQSDQKAQGPMRPDSISPRELHNPLPRPPLVIPAPQTAPSQSGSGRSSEDGLAPAPFDMACQSPRVTISVWDKDNMGPMHTVEGTFEDNDTAPETGVAESAGDLRSSVDYERSIAPQPRDSMGEWRKDPATGLGGLDPKRRIEGEIASINDIVRRREMDERNEVVGDWVTQNINVVVDNVQEKTSAEIRAIEEESRRSSDKIPFGTTTENRYTPGQTYYNPGASGQLTEEDYEIMLTNRNWADAPMLSGIQMGTPGQHQPQSSQAAIEKFERMCRDNDSIISRAATWGTRRRSLPSVVDLDIEGITSGNFLKKLSISRGNSGRSGSLLKDLRGLVRRPSAATIRKRSRSGQGEALFQQEQQQQPDESLQGKPESTTHLSPVSRTSSWGKKPTSSINEALVSMGHNFASIGAAHHSRSGSVSNLPTATGTSSRGTLSGLSVKTSLRRQRSKSELPKPSAPAESYSNLADLWRKTGGPPVASISRTHAEPDEEEDDDDDFSYEDNDMKMDPNLIDDIIPNNAGFSMHVQLLNPSLPANSYLVERLAQQQVIRYKQLLNYRIKHLGLGAGCPNGSLCVAMGGSANLLDSKGEARETDPHSHLTSFDGDDVASMEGAISQESFPADIPMPPTHRLPAEFECQLCYQHKKLSKPSDWTKHVHEDVQPFTCTWEKCQPKMFKRKADWVRHENEGHRHLEWWACDIEDCRHVCYRRDNFLQHLVREHKFVEPRVKNKAALKKASNLDVTWHKVEQCHRETPKQPSEEPCRFCGKQFPTWKKLTVHLAKHMEQIALPVLRLVAAKVAELQADTIISPVQDLPLRHDFHVLGEQQQSQQRSPALQYPGTPQQHAPQPSPFLQQPSPLLAPQQQQQQQQQSVNQQRVSLSFQQSPQNQSQLAYRMMPSGQFPSPFYTPQLEGGIGQNLHLHSHSHSSMGAGQPHSQGLSPDMWVMSAGGGNGNVMGSAPGFVQGVGSFGGMSGGGMSGGGGGGGSSVLVPSQSGMEQFRDGLDALGLPVPLPVQSIAVSHLGGQLSFDGMMDGSSGNGSPFSGHENLSPYSHSPQQNASYWTAGQHM